MTRSDARLMIAILATAVFTAGITTLVWYEIAPSPPPPPPAPVDTHTAELQQLRDRVTALEHANDPAQQVDPFADDIKDCDEVSCVLTNYDRPCCARFKLNDTLDRAQISSGIAAVKPRIQACNDKAHATGTIRVRAKVAPDGKVASASIAQTTDPDIGQCVVDKLMRAHFARTREGGTFSYPFVF